MKNKNKTKKNKGGGDETSLRRVINKKYSFSVERNTTNISYQSLIEGYFSGPWKYNKPYLKGRMVFINSMGIPIGKYIGQWINGKPNDFGMYTFDNGTNYIGQFKDGLFEGKGKLKYFNGDKYEGEFLQGVKQGEGIYTSTDGSVYIGNYDNNEKNGMGKLTTSTQEYSGMWKNGEPNGEGKMTIFTTGVIMEGKFQYVINQGSEVLKVEGTATYPDGSTFEGIFMDYRKTTGTAIPDNQTSLANNPLYDIKDGFAGQNPRNITDTEFL
jgi:hypothetical protein